jgi:ribonuclease Y
VKVFEVKLDALLQNPRYFAVLCFAVGFLLIMIVTLVLGYLRRAQSNAEAAELIADAQEKAQDIEDFHKRRAQEYIDKLTEQAEIENAKVEERIETLEHKVKEREARLEEKFKAHEESTSERQSEVDSYENRVRSVEGRVNQKRENERRLMQDLIQKLAGKLEVSVDEVKQQLQTKVLEDTHIETSKSIQAQEEEWQKLVEGEAKKLLGLAINRFARAYCPERGIGYLNFETEEQKNRVLGPEHVHLRSVEKLCGVDLAYDENNNAVQVYGFDPVRRELGRATVEKLMSEKNITPARIEQIFNQNKKTLFQKIINDGNRIANELRIDGLDKEIKNMMGALRYRYSFTQNQHFHCAEVGFLCGLLAAELDVPLKDARRAGLLHDIGKAMDHSIDGGHAVIGADFIKQHGEAEHIVHAVRAHHFDEQPGTDLAYLVIAADAISGARPGARRSTAATYTQKIQDLQTISRSFDGVMDTHVLSAGREVRVYVDGHKLDDLKALGLSREIAQKIENEMQYPGQIKVTVVRETQAVEYAK